MTVATPTPEPDDEAAKRILEEASDVIEGEQARIRIEIEFVKAARVGLLLVQWRKLMRDGNFSDPWIETAAMDIFHSFFPPFVATNELSFEVSHDHDDD